MYRLYQKMPKSVLGNVGLCITLLFIVLSLISPHVSPYDPEEIDLKNRLREPFWMEQGSWEHPFGTDMLGRDILSRVICGTRQSLIVGLISSCIALLIGGALGMLSGFLGGACDAIVMRIVDIMLAIPAVMLAVVVVAIIGPYPVSIILAMGLTMWTEYAKVIRGRILVLKEEPFVLVAQVMGASNIRIIVKHIFPNISYILIVVFTLQFGLIVLWSAGLSFIGLGGATLSWGWDISAGRVYLANAWWLSTIPGLAIFLCVIGWNLLGDWLRDVLDPGVKTVV